MDSLFCYGTLLGDALWERITAQKSCEAQSAILKGWRRFEVQGTDFLGIAPLYQNNSACGIVSGKIRPIHNPQIWHNLDTYEGDEYQRISVEVNAQEISSQVVFAYVYRPKVKIELLADHPEWIPWLSKMFYTEWGHYYPTLTVGEWETRLRGMIQREGIGATYVGVLHGAPVASARLKDQDMENQNDMSPWLAGVWVRPDLRGCGIGAQLVQAVEKEASKAGFSTLFLWTPNRNHFYANLGYTEIESVEYLSHPAIIMQKQF